MLKSLKWLLVLPVAVLAMLTMQLFCGFIAYDLGDSFPLNLIGGRYIAEFFMSVSASVAFVRGGCWMAPSHRTIVAFLLAALMATLALWSIHAVVSLPGFSLVATVVQPLPFGLNPQTWPAWWKLFTDAIWALSGILAALQGHEEHLITLSPDVTS
jgi:hypothetical protein